MPRSSKPRPRSAVPTILTLAVSVAVVAVVGLADARTPALQVARGAVVTNTAGKSTGEAIVTNSRGRAVYDLTGDRRGHAECTKANSCFSIWPPVTVASPRKLSKAAGIRGKLGTWHRNGLFQVTLNGHPLYVFSGDTRSRRAIGEGIHGFGGIWHVVRASVGVLTPIKPPTMTSTTTTTSTTSAGTSSTTSSSSMAPCLYPPC